MYDPLFSQIIKTTGSTGGFDLCNEKSPIVLGSLHENSRSYFKSSFGFIFIYNYFVYKFVYKILYKFTSRI